MQVLWLGSTTNPASSGPSVKIPDAASGIGPVRSFGSVAEYGLTAEQKPADRPSQLIGMIESPGALNVHSTVSPLVMNVTDGVNEPSAFTFTL